MHGFNLKNDYYNNFSNDKIAYLQVSNLNDTSNKPTSAAVEVIVGHISIVLALRQIPRQTTGS